jgi:hypothetical protein
MARFPSFAHSIARRNAMPKPNLRSRRARKLERKQGTRPSYPRLIIVCEGETETNYFDEIRQRWRIPALDWKILPSKFGSGPEKVVDYAETQAREEGRWEEVYCVFDRDDHHYYANALIKAQNISGKIRTKGREGVPISFTAIPSDPCFDLWFLIHFKLITREEHRDEILRLLKIAIPGYSKGCRGMFDRTIGDLNKACKHAESLRQRKSQTGNSNPSTDVDILVNRLNEIGKMNPSFRP